VVSHECSLNEQSTYKVNLRDTYSRSTVKSEYSVADDNTTPSVDRLTNLAVQWNDMSDASEKIERETVTWSMEYSSRVVSARWWTTNCQQTCWHRFIRCACSRARWLLSDVDINVRTSLYLMPSLCGSQRTTFINIHEKACITCSDNHMLLVITIAVECSHSHLPAEELTGARSSSRPNTVLSTELQQMEQLKLVHLICRSVTRNIIRI